jgi:hypothetical protein
MVDLADTHYPVEIEQARRKLGWEPRHRLRDTLSKMIGSLKDDPKRWYKVNKLTPPSSSTAEKQKGAKARWRGGIMIDRNISTWPDLPNLPNLHAAAPPWKHNPSSWRHRAPICVLAGVAIVISVYLALYQWRLIGSV